MESDKVDGALTIERLDPEADLRPIVEIEQASFSMPWTEDMFRWELRNTDVSATYVLRAADRRVVAFCCVWTVLDELHINNVAVRPGFRRHRFATMLLEHAMDEAAGQGVTKATLEVRRSNVGAIQLYERLGFSVTAVRPNYYSSPVEDALILWRSMRPQADRPPAP